MVLRIGPACRLLDRLRVFTLSRAISRTLQAVVGEISAVTVNPTRNWRGWQVLLLQSEIGQTSSSCSEGHHG